MDPNANSHSRPLPDMEAKAVAKPEPHVGSNQVQHTDAEARFLAKVLRYGYFLNIACTVLIRHVSDYARASEDPETQRECNRVALALGIIARVPLASMLTFLPFLNHSRLNAVVRCASSTVATASQRIETEPKAIAPALPTCGEDSNILERCLIAVCEGPHRNHIMCWWFALVLWIMLYADCANITEVEKMKVVLCSSYFGITRLCADVCWDFYKWCKRRAASRVNGRV